MNELKFKRPLPYHRRQNHALLCFSFFSLSEPLLLLNPTIHSQFFTHAGSCHRFFSFLLFNSPSAFQIYIWLCHSERDLRKGSISSLISSSLEPLVLLLLLRASDRVESTNQERLSSTLPLL
ncbi:hypothetical protein MANES_12G028850v8 [Manihot esculenta]|uniref:Uncharacterized protein n=1 Tax=Manihot esculenta TaxID=3983 RepID=A0ACB7GP87_MANES|nr:hypothetical protein MANES_12G028850v8 [Manihot esculenta]